MRVGFGLEKLGLVALRSPRVTLAVVVLVTAFFATGITQLQFSSELREIFRSDSPHYATFQKMTDQFPGSERDVFLLVEGDDLFNRQRLEALRDLHIELRWVEGAKSVLSVFSARMPPRDDGTRPYVIPASLDDVENLGDLQDTLLQHPLVAGKLLDDAATLTLMVIALDESHRGFGKTRRVIKEIEATARSTLADPSVSVSLTGMPVVRVLVIGLLTSDQLVFKFSAYAITLLLSWLFFRSFRFLVLAVLPPVIASIWLLGGMGWAGQDINVVTNVVPNLVMVITFANSIHLLVAIRRHRSGDNDHRQAISTAVSEIGPATVLTSLTTAIALLCLTLTGQQTIVAFASVAAYGTGLAFIVVMTVIPPLGHLLLFNMDGKSVEPPAFPRLIDHLSGMAARLVSAQPSVIVAAGCIVFLLAGSLYLMNTPHFRYRSNLPSQTEPYRAMETIDARLAGTSTLRVFIEWPEDYELISQPTLQLVERVDDVLKRQPQIRSVWSLHNSAQWLMRGGWSEDDYRQHLRDSPPEALRRFLSPDTQSALVTGQMPDIDAAELMPVIAGLEAQLRTIAAEFPGATVSVTGIAVQSARSALEMIDRLNRSLLIAIAVIIALIGICLRSVGASLVSIVPNLFPIAMAGSLLYVSGRELQFTSIIVFAIGFGIAVDSTIHMLNHFRHSRRVETEPVAALTRTITAIGPALIVSTIALMAGGVTLLSPLPMAQLYGQLMLVVLTTALVGDILFLPALVLLVERWRRR
jgi:hypothetical protein